MVFQIIYIDWVEGIHCIVVTQNALSLCDINTWMDRCDKNAQPTLHYHKLLCKISRPTKICEADFGVNSFAKKYVHIILTYVAAFVYNLNIIIIIIIIFV